MELLLVGRTVQGAAGGLLAGLGYAVINSALPQFLVDQGVGAGVGDVGRRHPRRPGGGWPVRPIRFVALGFRCARRLDRGDGRSGSLSPARADRRADDARTPIPVWSLLLLGRRRLSSAWRVYRVTWATVAAGRAGGGAGRGLSCLSTVACSAAVLPPSAFGPDRLSGST